MQSYNRDLVMEKSRSRCGKCEVCVNLHNRNAVLFLKSKNIYISRVINDVLKKCSQLLYSFLFRSLSVFSYIFFLSNHAIPFL